MRMGRSRCARPVRSQPLGRGATLILLRSPALRCPDRTKFAPGSHPGSLRALWRSHARVASQGPKPCPRPDINAEKMFYWPPSGEKISDVCNHDSSGR